jgi:predicted Zn-dependent protease
MATAEAASRIDRLMDAIELVKADRRREAINILRELIREDNDFEDAWLWMSVAVDSLDQSSICLDNVLRVNPGNSNAASALHRIRSPEMEMEKRRGRIRIYRDLAFSLLWILVFVLLYTLLFTFLNVTA